MAEFKIVRDAAEIRVELGDKLTASVLPSLQAALKQEIHTGARGIVFDFALTVTIDSSGIGLLIATGNSMASVQGSLRLTGLSTDIFKLLQSMRLVDRLHATCGSTEIPNGQ